MANLDHLVDGFTFIDYLKNWIIDSGCSHHLIRDGSLLSLLKEYMGDKSIPKCVIWSKRFQKFGILKSLYVLSASLTFM